MNYGELKAQFEGLLKRRDLTPLQSETFMRQGINRAQRVLRIPPMEKSIEVIYDGVVFTDGELPIPGDYLKLISITTNNVELKLHDMTTVLERARYSGRPTMYTRRGSKWKFAPTPDAGTRFRIDYYDEFGALTAPTDSNYLTQGANDLAIYAALSYAGDWFVDRRQPAWETRFMQITDEIQYQADSDAMVNAVASAAYSFPED